MSKCRSWRPLVLDPSMGIPGHDRHKWEPCHNEALDGFDRCVQCFRDLAVHPDPLVRLWLASERPLPAEVVDVLTSDTDSRVRAAVSERR